MMVGQHPKTGEWSLEGEVSEVTYGRRAYRLAYHEGGGRMFARPDLKVDKSGRFDYTATEMRDMEHFCRTDEGQGNDAYSAIHPRRANSAERRSARLLSKRNISFPDLPPLVVSGGQ